MGGGNRAAPAGDGCGAVHDRRTVQGFDPVPGFGRSYVEAYYDKQPIGLMASYELLSVRPLTDGIVSAYARVRFDRPDGAVPVYLTVIAQRSRESWQISHYHVSKIKG
jgi:hypothetical protein